MPPTSAWAPTRSASSTTEHGAGSVALPGRRRALAAAAAAVFGLLAIRATGTYFLMITLALGMVIWGLAFAGSRSPRATTASPACRGRPGLPWTVARPVPFYYFAFVRLALAWRCWGCVVRSPFGLGAARHPRAASRACAGLGYHVWLHKYIAFVHLRRRSAALPACSGPTTTASSAPTDVQLVTSVETLLMVALGGRGTLIGPALGAGVIVFLKNFVSVYTKRWLLILGGVYIGVHPLRARRGIVGALGAGGPVTHDASALAASTALPRPSAASARVDGVTLAVARRRAPRPHRPQRRREDHAVQPDHRARCRPSRHHRAVRPRRHARRRPPPRRARAGPHLPDHQPLPDADRAGELPARGAGRPPARFTSSARPDAIRPCSSARAAALRAVGLADRGGRGRREPLPRRAAPARDRLALAGAPRLLLLDEPTAGLSGAESARSATGAARCSRRRSPC